MNSSPHHHSTISASYSGCSWRKRLELALLLISLVSLLTGCDSTTPEADLGLYDAGMTTVTPEEVGWSSARLEEVRQHAESLGTAALMILVDGEVVAAWGAVERTFVMASIRKSLLSALYGIYRHEGQLDLSRTMADLGIDDEPPLTDAEKQATVAALLKSRSGIYHEAAAETQEARNARPPRGSHAPGAFWYYNNWDFNALGAIFEQETGVGIFEAFKARIADPIGMQDFRVDEAFYAFERHFSIHPAYHFRLSARDLARFGQLMLQQGQRQGTSIIPAEWVAESTTAFTATGDRGTKSGYGYMWWVTTNDDQFPEMGIKNGTYTASGNGGQRLTVLPHLGAVVVHLMNTYRINGPRIGTTQYDPLLKQIIEARIE